MESEFYVMGRMDDGVLTPETGEIQVPPDWFLLLQNRLTHQTTLLWGTAPTDGGNWGKRCQTLWKHKLCEEWGLDNQTQIVTSLFKNPRIVKQASSVAVALGSGPLNWGLVRTPGGPVIPLNALAKRHNFSKPGIQAALSYIRDYVLRTERPSFRGLPT